MDWDYLKSQKGKLIDQIACPFFKKELSLDIYRKT